MIKAIDDNRQSEEKQITLYEEDARKMYRKWDNVKHISEKIKEKRVPRKAYDSGLWGLKINTKERLQKRKDSLPFGVVVTLKEMNGVNPVSYTHLYASSLLSDQYFAVLSNVCNVCQRKPRYPGAGAEVSQILRKTGVFVSGAFADGGEV